MDRLRPRSRRRERERERGLCKTFCFVLENSTSFSSCVPGCPSLNMVISLLHYTRTLWTSQTACDFYWVCSSLCLLASFLPLGPLLCSAVCCSIFFPDDCLIFGFIHEVLTIKLLWNGGVACMQAQEVVVTAIGSPIPHTLYPFLAVLLLIVGLVLTAAFFM